MRPIAHKKTMRTENTGEGVSAADGGILGNMHGEEEKKAWESVRQGMVVINE